MLVSDYNYDLPEERIAKFPPAERGSTRLLVLHRDSGALEDDFYRNLDAHLSAGDVLILNDTRVMRSRLFCELPDGRPRELIVLEKHGAESQKVMYRGKLHVGDVLNIVTGGSRHSIVSLDQLDSAAKNHDKITLRTNQRITVTKIIGNGLAEVSSDTDLHTLTERFGNVPLPPYLHRNATPEDTSRYQTVWAKYMGSAAAPTASLNMTSDLLARLAAKGVIIKYLTLHVGLGTFLPIRSDKVEDHEMHSEWFHIPADTLSAISEAKSSDHRVVALGTTVARTLEFYAKTGLSEGEDNIFIYPGFEFQLIDALVTNFHAPKSTVLMLAAAFAGWDYLHAAYDHAVAENYNFLSYGDSMFIC